MAKKYVVSLVLEEWENDVEVGLIQGSTLGEFETEGEASEYFEQAADAVEEAGL